MHPTDKKNTIYFVLLVLLLTPVLLFYWLKSTLFVVYSFIALLVIDKYSKKFVHSILITFILSSIGFITFSTVEYFLGLISDWIVYVLAIPIVFSFVVPTLLLTKIYETLNKILEASADEKNNYFAIKRYPNLVCLKHNTRTTFHRHFLYNSIACRVNKKCFAERKLIYATHIIGVIGRSKTIKSTQGKYYVPLWNEKEHKINNADYDLIEIYENDEIADYNALINRVVDFFYNEIDRYKPINKVVVRIFGTPNISENTKRLLNERFLKIEYLNN